MINRNFSLILLGNVILGVALPMLVTLGPLAGGWLAPQAWLATAPLSVSMLAGIAVASPMSLFMGRYGRRAGFLVGAMTLTTGALLAVGALLVLSFPLLCAAHGLMGCALVCINYFRFAAAEAVGPDHRSQAISLTLASGLVGALVGAQVFALSKDVLAPTPLAGAYAALAIVGVIGALPVLGMTSMRVAQPVRRTAGALETLRTVIRRDPRVLMAIGVAALSQAVMVLMMTPTPLAMEGCGFAEDQAAGVISWHVVAMFAPGLFAGSLIKRFGAGRMATAGFALIAFAAVVALLGVELVNFYAALIILGVGWNFAFVSGTYMLQGAVGEDEAPALQGANDTILAIAAASASLLSGMLFVGIGWIGLTTLTIPLCLLFGFLLLRTNRRAAA
ncbi:MFS transporter [Jannaschia pagri]|uniref:MFS transporter n=1 Tax=Jannaschia pagri TaxID=2829797 RepID=A0ABQ4NL74_9RHOB|nr:MULTISPECIES: MFS transporter [unclassified Jannaschia]GIT91335.1 MFS transporter [Jannaschia sp. AI_61]GIT95168.1 MFS transporter [Jannaschia sp. AI_62]